LFVGDECVFTLCNQSALTIFPNVSEPLVGFRCTGFFCADSQFATDSWIFQVFIDGELANPDVNCSTQLQLFDDDVINQTCGCSGGSISALDANFGCDFDDAGCTLDEALSNLAVSYTFPVEDDGNDDGNDDDNDGDDNGDGNGNVVIVLLVVAALLAGGTYAFFLLKKRRESKRMLSLRIKPVTATSSGSSTPDQIVYNSSNPVFSNQVLSKVMVRPPATPVARHYPSSHESVTTVGTDFTRFFSLRFDSINSNDVDIDFFRSSIKDEDIRNVRALKRLSSAASQRYNGKVESINRQKNLDRLTTRLQSTKLQQFHGVSTTPSVVPMAYDKSRTIVAMVISSLEIDEEKLANKDKFADSAKYKEPEIPLDVFLDRLVRYLDKWFYDLPGLKAVGTRSLLFSMLYFERIRNTNAEFRVTKFNIHRLFAISMLVAAKFSEDEVITNSYWASVIGIQTSELNEMEQIFCNMAGYDFWVSQEEVTRIYDAFKPK